MKVNERKIPKSGEIPLRPIFSEVCVFWKRVYQRKCSSQKENDYGCQEDNENQELTVFVM